MLLAEARGDDGNKAAGVADARVVLLTFARNECLSWREWLSHHRAQVRLSPTGPTSAACTQPCTRTPTLLILPQLGSSHK